jgi:hypothetical protein
MTMKTNPFPTVALGALIALAGASHAFAMDHGSMNHGSAAPGGGTAAQPARPGVEIRKSVVSGYALTYTLTDMKAMVNLATMPTTPKGDATMKSHRLAVSVVGPDGKPVRSGKVGYLVTQPDKTEVKTLTMPMEEGFSADLDLNANGEYAITTKMVLGDKTLVDTFVYAPKKAAAGKNAVANALCPITGGALGPDVPERLTRTYKGQKIGFCCDGCPESWDRLTDAEKDAALAKAKKPVK